MSKRLTCPAGHHWIVADFDPSAPSTVCPDCGALARDEPTQVEGLLPGVPYGSWPHLGQPPVNDSGATIAAEPHRTIPPDSMDFQVTLGPLQELAPAIRLSVPGYEILAELGRGGMGVVYKARQIELRRLVALKMVLAGIHLGERELMRFRSEAAAVAGLQHVHIVQLYEFGEHEGRPYFSLEYVEGGSLAQRMRGEPLPVTEAARVTEKLARAIHFAHQNGIVHRDIKPANILLTADGEPKITDFGLAKHVHAATAHTQTGTVMGTPSYMAPEQAMGKSRDVGPAADVYALGAILYEMLSGRPPFRSETPLDTMLQVASEEPVPLSRLQPRLPPDLQTICMKCLQKQPHQRYPSALDLAEDLRRFNHGEPIDARPIGKLERVYRWARRRPAMAALIALASFTVIAGFAAVTWEWHEEALQRARLEAAQKETALHLVRAENSLYCNRIALAEREWLANNVARARLLLRDCRTDLRGWEWNYLYRLCNADLLTLRGHDSVVHGLAFSPDGKHIVSASADQTIKVWDATAGKVLFTQTGPVHRDRGVSVVFGPDGKHIFYAGSQSIIQSCDAHTGQDVRTMQRPGGKALCTAFTPNRQRLALGGADGTIRIWALGTAKEAVLNGHTNGVQSLAFGPEGRLLVSGGHDGTVRVWDAASGVSIRTMAPAHQGVVHSVVFSPEGRRVVSTGEDTTVKVWDALSGKLIATFRGHHKPVTCVAFDPNKGGIIASAGQDQIIKLWDAVTAEERFTLRGHTDKVRCLAFRRDGKMLASAGEDRVIKVWDARTGQEARKVEAQSASRCVAYAPEGLRLATADRAVQLWDPATLAPLQVLGGPSELIRGVAFHPQGRMVATAGADLKVRDVATGRELLAPVRPSPAHYSTVAFSPDGQRLASGGDDGVVRIWDPDTGKVVFTLMGHQGAVHSVAFSPDGQQLASAGGDHLVKVWDPATGQEIRTLRGHNGSVNAVAYSPLGRYLASGGDSQGSRDGETGSDGDLKVWDPRTGELKHTLWGHSGAINSVAFTPDGERLATASDDQTVKIWDPAFGQEVLTLRGHTQSVLGVAFSPDGHHLASIASDQTVRIWNATPLP